MGFGVVDFRISLNLQAAVFQGPGEGFGIGDDLFLVFVSEGVHLISRQEQAQEGSQVVIAEAPGESPPGDGLPEVVVI